MAEKIKHVCCISYFKVVIISVLLGGLAGAAASAGLINYLYGHTAPLIARTDWRQSQAVSGGGHEAISAVVEKTSPAVVSIIISKELSKMETNIRNPFADDPFFRQFFGDDFNLRVPNQKDTGPQEIGGGTGFIVSADGYIVTNKHVVMDTDAEYTVLMNDGSKHTAKVLARDPVNDIAIIKIDGKNLPVISLGDSSQVRLGQSVIAIGNALGEFRNTVSAGIISGLARSLTADGGDFSEQLSGLFQTDAAINSGNSGGPLLDLQGRVIGINTAMANGAQSIGFAIPINDVKAVIEGVQQYGKIIRPFLGVRHIVVTPAIAKKNNLSVDYGALIVRGADQSELAVMPGSPADKAGLVENDIILEVDGQKVTIDTPLAKLIATHKPGDTLSFKIMHRGEIKTISVTLTEYKDTN